ncbi:MAG: molecular chaperone, partial [Acetatifactor sp.]|nr:molecular chaperone [Acetatifactor sp.]
MSGYILNREGLQDKVHRKRYRQSELELMTTHQLREICRKEKIIQGIINPMDKEELIHVIMRYRGTREEMLIRHESGTGKEVLEQMLAQGKIKAVHDKTLHIPSKIIVYEGLAMNENDRIRIPYRGKLENTNALLISGEKKLCGIFYLQKAVHDGDHLYVMKDGNINCTEADLKDYDLYCFEQQDSDRIFSVYSGSIKEIPEVLTAYRIPLMDVEVRKPIPLRMPLVVDFGSTNTTAGVYLDSLYFESAKGAPFAETFTKNSIQYTLFEDGTKLMPSVVGGVAVKHGQQQFVFGQAAVDLSNASYVDEGFSIFYDMKRWITDYEKEEEITDREGRRTFLPRKKIIRAYFEHIIEVTENLFKCRVGQVYV